MKNDQLEIYDMPDNFPLTVPRIPTEETGTISFDELI